MTIRVPMKFLIGLVAVLGMAGIAFVSATLEDAVFNDDNELDDLDTRLRTAERARDDLATLANRLDAIESGSVPGTPEVTKQDLCRVAVGADGAIIALLASQGRFAGDAEAAKTFLRGAGYLSSENLRC